MSQLIMLGDDGVPGMPDIQFIQGITGTKTGPNPADFTVDFISSTGDLSIFTDPVTFEVDFTLANKFEGTATTVGAVTANILSVPLGATPGTYQFEARVKGYKPAATAAGCGYNIYATFTTDGASATLVGNQDIFNEDAALAAADAYFVASGNNAVLQVLGVALLTINWVGETELT